MIFFTAILIVLTTLLSRKRGRRIKEEIKRWKEIKELEEDYDVYVSDEYAYHIADSKLQLHQIQDLGIANLDQGYGKVRKTGSFQQRRSTQMINKSSQEFEENKNLSQRSGTIVEDEFSDKSRSKKNRMLSIRSDATLNVRNHSYSFIKERVD